MAKVLDSTGSVKTTTVSSFTASSTDTLTNKTFDANGTGNVLSNVDVADLASGTDGELITWDSAGNPTTVPAGTATHVLTSNGAGAEPTFQAAAGGGLANVVEDLTPQLGGDLDTNDKDILIDSGRGIRDEADNEQILFTTVASATNYLHITNAATGNDPSWVANGSDTNVGLILDGKGTGTIAIGSADSVLSLTGTSISGSAIKDEDDMTSNSATHLATQQSIKAYADSVSDWVLISSATASASATISFTGLSSTYKHYVLTITDLIPATDNVILYLRTSTNGGSTYDSGASDYIWNTNVTTGAANFPAGATAAQIRLLDTVGNAAGEVANGVVWLHAPSTATKFMTNSHLSHFGASDFFAETLGNGVRNTAADVDAVQLLMSSGNITSGEFRLYGVKNA
jgi:hypothetical protein